MKKLCLIMGAIAILATSGYADSVSDQLKVADCNFQILRKGKPVKVIKQMITLRAVAEKGMISPEQTMIQRPDITDVPYSTGYCSYHVEFSYTGDRLDFTEIDEIEFYTGKTLVYVMDIENLSRLMSESDERTEQKIRYFSINLQGIPLLMLDDITSINIKE